MKLKTLDTVSDFSNKTVLLRIDSDVDVVNGVVTDETRLMACIDTLSYITQKGGKVILIGHLGRPTEKYKVEEIKYNMLNSQFSLLPVAHWFEKKLSGKLSEVRVSDFPGWKITESVTLLENIRFYQGEEKPDSDEGRLLSERLKHSGHIYVDDAFAVSHRNHVSIAMLPALLPSVAGFHFAQEVKVLGDLMEHPTRPLVVLIGGAKIETKLPMVSKMLEVSDFVLVGGKIAEEYKHLPEEERAKIEKSMEGKTTKLLIADAKDHGKDITVESVDKFIEAIKVAKSIIWNGPVGLTNNDPSYEEGTKRLAEAIVASSAYKVVGGGDSLSFLTKVNLLDKFDFVSTAGGAMLEFLAGKELPGIKPLLE